LSDDYFNDDHFNDEDYEYEIESEGMLQRGYRWIPITCLIKVDREKGQAVHGLISVFDEVADCDIYESKISWVAKSKSANPWFICTVIFEEKNKVANSRWWN